MNSNLIDARLGIALTRDRTVLMIAGVCTGLIILGYFFPPRTGTAEIWMDTLNRVLAIVAVWIIAMLVYQRKHTDRALRELSRQLIEFQDRESQQIGREIHECIAQSLTALRMSIETLLEDGCAGQEARVKKILETLTAIVEDCRNLSRGIHPSIPRLEDAIEDLVESARQNTGMLVELVQEPAEVPLQNEIITNCYRILEEALSNVEAHAAASHVRIEVTADEGALHMSVTDDGKGFYPARRGGILPAGLGLAVMQQRAKLLGGELSVSSALGKGTRVDLVVPLGEYGN